METVEGGFSKSNSSNSTCQHPKLGCEDVKSWLWRSESIHSFNLKSSYEWRTATAFGLEVSDVEQKEAILLRRKSGHSCQLHSLQLDDLLSKPVIGFRRCKVSSCSSSLILFTLYRVDVIIGNRDAVISRCYALNMSVPHAQKSLQDEL